MTETKKQEEKTRGNKSAYKPVRSKSKYNVQNVVSGKSLEKTAKTAKFNKQGKPVQKRRPQNKTSNNRTEKSTKSLKP